MVYQVEAAWLEALVQLVADTYRWRLLKLDQHTTVRSQGGMYLNSTFARNMTKVDGDRIPMVKDDLRRTAMKRLAKTNQTGSERRRRVVIYSREDSKFRNIKNTGALVDLFDDNRFEVTVHTRLPASFWEQVAFFADIDLLIAAIGGWAPNVLWLPPDACLVEIHLFRLGTVGFTWLVWRDFSVPVIS
jgi:capsular polysaccharide biosynthesis protein